nr:hypothetical protein CFP56_71043 [Quercus suber]
MPLVRYRHSCLECRKRILKLSTTGCPWPWIAHVSSEKTMKSDEIVYMMLCISSTGLCSHVSYGTKDCTIDSSYQISGLSDRLHR